MAKEKKDEKRYIPLKNYYIAAFILIVIILITLYSFKWYQVKEDEKLRESYLVTTETVTLEINDFDELKQVFAETPEEYFVYIGYRNNRDVYNLEKDLKKIIDDYNLKDFFYYVDATDLMKEDEYLNKLNSNLNLTKDKLEKVPSIIYFSKEGYEIIKRDDKNMIKAADLGKLLDIKEFEKVAK